MRLQGIHHITAITGDAPVNVNFYVRVLGLRMVKKTVNYDAPEVYHLYYADEPGTPGSVLTFFEYPGAPPGRAGAGMIHRISWRIDRGSIDFWRDRLEAEGLAVAAADEWIRFRDPEGLGLELVADDSGEEPLRAQAPDVPDEHALRGFDSVRAFHADPDRSESLLTNTLGFTVTDDGYIVQGEKRHSTYAYDPPTATGGVQGGGTVHHIAFASHRDDHEAWHRRVTEAGARVTAIIDRTYFHSIYFREPSGVLFEIATLGPGFTVDEPVESLGEKLVLPERYELLRPQLEKILTPVENPRTRVS